MLRDGATAMATATAMVTDIMVAMVMDKAIMVKQKNNT